MKGRQLVPIQPKPGPVGWEDQDQDLDPDPNPQSNRTRKVRSAVLVACDPCRRIKSKVREMLHPTPLPISLCLLSAHLSLFPLPVRR